MVCSLLGKKHTIFLKHAVFVSSSEFESGLVSEDFGWKVGPVNTLYNIAVKVVPFRKL